MINTFDETKYSPENAVNKIYSKNVLKKIILYVIVVKIRNKLVTHSSTCCRIWNIEREENGGFEEKCVFKFETKP